VRARKYVGPLAVTAPNAHHIHTIGQLRRPQDHLVDASGGDNSGRAMISPRGGGRIVSWQCEAKGEAMSQQVKLIALLKARPGMTRDEFARRWIEAHAPLTLRFPNLKGYRMNVPLDEYQEIEGELPYDGTAELWWDSLAEMQADYASKEAEAAVADVKTFTRELIHIYMREHVLR
jgi:uncharacterized protein (TIGR02118 family)